MYLQPNQHIYLTQFRNELIFLDIKKDKYFIIPNPNLPNILFGLFYRKTQNKTHPTIDKLVSSEILVQSDLPFAFEIDIKSDALGMQNIDWRLPLSGVNASYFRKEIMRALYNLVRVHTCIKFKGFHALIQMIKSQHQKRQHYVVPSHDQLVDMADILNKACMIYPKRTKCLEWAATFTLLCLKKGWQCNLVIGVQNYPFMAHAWVESNKKVIQDAENLPNDMSVILEEPFRKKREV